MQSATQPSATLSGAAPPPSEPATRSPQPATAFSILLRRREIALILAVVALLALFGPWLLPAHFGEPSRDNADQFLPPFTRGHLLGTDINGRDLLYRIFIGARISLLVGISGALVALFVGTAYGLVAGYVGGRVDSVMMRVVDALYAIPRLIFILILVAVVEGPFRRWLDVHFAGSGLGFLRDLPAYTKTLILILSLGLIEWLTMARIVRGQVLVLKNLQFVTAARSLGQTHWKILTRHLLPNLTGLVAVYLTLTIPAVILDESFLSYLGLGVDASQASWGTLLADGAGAINPIKSHWWLLIFPAAIMSLTLLALNFLGDGLRDVLDPRSRK